ncbi:MsnO8 family LLM class oxidoreductase [Nocardia sp. NPDC024068]|uniref:MsnO8 family LLM class oxidoreductase n=1 Tax=Nocardia sp. NPDC024068 TaxID=3157197 RepID=UPI0033D3CEA7
MELSLLDRSRTRTGEPESAALAHTVARAIAAEASGYRRFWVAEHHAVPGIASGSPPVLMAALGARTSSIRIGAGGVMLPYHQPLVVAEQFLMLEALYPGRVDLGLGRSPAFTAPVRRAMRQGAGDPDRFEADVAELLGYLDGSGAVTARPVIATAPPAFVLATGRGLEVAARLGLPAVLGGPILHSAELEAVLARYRREFVPSPRADRPEILIALDIVVAESDEQARELALPEAWAMAVSRSTGEFPPLESVSSIKARHRTEQTRRRVDANLDTATAGSPATVRRRLEQLTERTGATELLATTSTFDRDALAASDAALARIFYGRAAVANPEVTQSPAAGSRPPAVPVR